MVRGLGNGSCQTRRGGGEIFSAAGGGWGRKMQTRVDWRSANVRRPTMHRSRSRGLERARTKDAELCRPTLACRAWFGGVLGGWDWILRSEKSEARRAGREESEWNAASALDLQRPPRWEISGQNLHFALWRNDTHPPTRGSPYFAHSQPTNSSTLLTFFLRPRHHHSILRGITMSYGTHRDVGDVQRREA